MILNFYVCENIQDYAIDFDDEDHPVKAFECCCGSGFCRDSKKKHKEALL